MQPTRILRGLAVLALAALTLGPAAGAETVLFDSSSFSGAIVNTSLNFTPVAGQVYTLSFNDSNPANAHGNHVIGFARDTTVGGDADWVDAFFFAMRNDGSGVTDDTNVQRYYSGGAHETRFTATLASGNGYMGPAGTLSTYTIVLDTTGATWTSQATMSSSLGMVTGGVMDLGASPTIQSVQIWNRDPGSTSGDGDVSNFLLTMLGGDPPPLFGLTLTPNGSDLDFTWPSQTGKVYDLLSDTDLSSDSVTTWSPYNDGATTHQDIPASGTGSNAVAIPQPGDAVRFFAVAEKDPGPPVGTAVALHGLFTDHMVLQREKPVEVYGTAAPGGHVLVSFAGQSKAATADAQGHWSVTLDAMAWSATPATMTVAGLNTLTLDDIVVGDVWVCSGQSNMDFTPGAYGAPYNVLDFDVPLVRQFHVAAEPSLSLQTSVSGNTQTDPPMGGWLVASPETGVRFCAVGLYFARKVTLETGLPIGLIKAAVNGTRIEPWITPAGWDSVPELPPVGPLPDTVEYTPYPSTPHCLYNSWIHPLTRFAIKGALWYQGESNGGEGDSYYHKKQALIGGWRTAFGQGDFPFYYVQLAAWQSANSNPAGGDGWAPTRVAQLDSLAIPNTGMASALDLANVGEINIHPFDKKSVGERLALWALARDYDQTSLVYSGPLYSGMAVEADKIRISFDSVGSGLIIANIAGGFQPLVRDPEGALQRFAIAGADKTWYWADAVIDGATVLVSSPSVPNPVAVRYAYSNNPEGANLYNEEGLPASPFRTDDW